jgi:hypothetical protein
MTLASAACYDLNLQQILQDSGMVLTAQWQKPSMSMRVRRISWWNSNRLSLVWKYAVQHTLSNGEKGSSLALFYQTLLVINDYRASFRTAYRTKSKLTEQICSWIGATLCWRYLFFFEISIDRFSFFLIHTYWISPITGGESKSSEKKRGQIETRFGIDSVTLTPLWNHPSNAEKRQLKAE